MPLRDDVLVTADETVSIRAEAGGIALEGSVTVGDETTDENSAHVVLAARDDIEQSVTQGDGGVRAAALEASSSQGSIALGAGRDEAAGSDGNAFSTAVLDSAGDIVLASSGRDTLLEVNAENQGMVNGDLKLYGEDNGFKFENELTVRGDALIDAAAVHGVGIEAEKALEIVAAHHDDSRGPDSITGIDFTGDLEGSHVTLITDNGDIHTGAVSSTEGFVNIYRLGTSERGGVTVGGGSSAHTAAIYNGSGDVNVAGDFTAAYTLYVLTAAGGAAAGAEHLHSLISKAAAVGGADPLTSVIRDALIDVGGVAGMRPGMLPHLDFSVPALEDADVARVSPFFLFEVDARAPVDSFFFLHLRPDAQSAKPDEEKESGVLEEGLPGHPGGVIRDLRVQADPMPRGLTLESEEEVL